MYRTPCTFQWQVHTDKSYICPLAHLAVMILPSSYMEIRMVLRQQKCKQKTATQWQAEYIRTDCRYTYQTNIFALMFHRCVAIKIAVYL